MKTIRLQSGKEEMSVEVPSIAFGFDVNNYADSSELMYMVEIESTTCDNMDETLITIPLPKGNWKIIKPTHHD
jgi:hypothetical protein